MIHIKKFIQKTQSARQARQKNINMSLQEAEQLSTDLTLLLADYADATKKLSTQEQTDTLEVELVGEKW